MMDIGGNDTSAGQRGLPSSRDAPEEFLRSQ